MRDIDAMGFQLSFIPAHNYTQVPDMIDFDCHFVSRRSLIAKGFLRAPAAEAAADGSRSASTAVPEPASTARQPNPCFAT